MDKLVSVVVPVFNEEKRILPVLNSLKKAKSCGEIIIVDDGSNQKTKEILAKIKGVKVITHPKNLGKAQALKTGILKAKLPYIAFIDSDLVGFTPSHFEKLVCPLLMSKYDISFSDREKEYFHSRFSGFSLAFTGDRAFRREILVSNIDVFDVKGYLVEPSMNRRFYGHCQIAKVLFQNVGQCAKHRKTGFILGWWNDIKMLGKIVKFLGPIEFFRELYFAKKLSVYSQ